MKPLVIFIAAISCAFGAVDGTVINGTTGKPQGAVMVSLMQPSAQGLQTLATVRSDADGKFRIDKDVPAGGPVMIQAIFEKASYTEMMPPGSPTSGLQVQVFNASKDPESGKIAEHMILIEPAADALQVSETFLFNNETKQTFADPANGSAEFYVPRNATGKPQVTITSATGVPVQWSASKTAKPDIYKIDFPIKPGQTRFDIGYTLPPSTSLAGKNLAISAPTRLVTPGSVTLSGDGLDLLGQEPQTQARIYNLRTPTFDVKIDGFGSIRNQQADAPPEDTGQPQIEVAPARIYSRMGWVLGLTLGILALGGAMLFRKGTLA